MTQSVQPLQNTSIAKRETPSVLPIVYKIKKKIISCSPKRNATVPCRKNNRRMWPRKTPIVSHNSTNMSPYPFRSASLISLKPMRRTAEAIQSA